jgi:hypothetical protein
MKMKLDKKSILRKIDGDEVFFVNDGSVIRSLRDLPAALTGMQAETFMFHKERDDFSNWIRDVCGDRRLATELSKIKTQTTSIRKVKERVDVLLK